MEKVTMSQKEADQIIWFERLKRKEVKQQTSAEALGLSVRQVKRKLKGYRQNGAVSLVHGLRGKAGNHGLDEELKSQALALVREKYADCGPTFASEKLREIEGVLVNHETLRHWMMDCDPPLWQKGVSAVKHRSWRERKAMLGMLIQLDGSEHDWFEGRDGAEKCTLLAWIDDATSQILWLEFVRSEATRETMQAFWHYLDTNGRPEALYVDRGKVWAVNLRNEEGDKFSQFERALRELNVGVIHALSPQAKGRVERLFGTLQDRLVKELRFRSISDMVTANQFVQTEYMGRHNQKFAVAAREPGDAHRPVEGFNLADTLAEKDIRSVQFDFCLSYKRRWLQLTKEQPLAVRPHDKVTILERLDQSLGLLFRDQPLNFTELTERPARTPTPQSAKPSRKSWIPAANHPWRRYARGRVTIPA